MTQTPRGQVAEHRRGYVLRGGPFDGAVVHARRPAFVHIEHFDGIGDVYTPSGSIDDEHPGFERYDFEEAMSDHGRPHARAVVFGDAAPGL